MNDNQNERIFQLSEKLMEFLANEEKDPILWLPAAGIFITILCKAHKYGKEHLLTAIDKTWDFVEDAKERTENAKT